ncbi:MAG: OmpA family protein [Candidatus Kapabacteria bacterium]|nr:OmpA family protein [Candidatus Kapabacteria bacterium]
MIIFILTCALFPINSYSADSFEKVILGTGYGGYVNYNLNSHIANFQRLPGIPNCCPDFKTGDGTGLTFGFVFDYPIFTNFSVNAKLEYSGLNGLLSAIEPTKVAIDSMAVDGEFSHTMDAKLALISIKPGISFNIFDKLHINAAINIGYLLTKNYTQEEKITQPINSGTFIDSNGKDTKLRVQHQSTGTIPEVNPLILGVEGGLSYELPLNASKSMLLYPEINYYYSLTNIVNNLSWKANSLKFGLCLMYSTSKYTEIKQIIPQKEDENDKIFAFDEEYEIIGNSDNIIYGTYNRKDNEFIDNTIEAASQAYIRAVGVDDNIEDNKATLRVEEFLSNNLRPLLNYVFFEKNSSELQSKYIKLNNDETNGFSVDKLSKSGTLATYYNVLNIVAKRMKDFPNSKITVTGCNSDNDKEKGNKELSKKRAEIIFDYLTSVWNIEKSRINIQTRNLPETPSNIKVPDGVEENRRVEISSDTYEILEPVYTKDTLLKASPPIIRFYNAAKTESAIKKWRITAEQGGKILEVFEKEDTLPRIVDWKIDRNKDKMPRFESDIKYKLEFWDSYGKLISSGDKALPTEQVTIRKKKANRQGDKIVDKYSLILFQFNSSELSSANQKICDFIKSKSQASSKFNVTGYTDRVGDQQKNLQLSEDRAKAVKNLMNSKNVYINYLGGSDLLYDNDLPEGRFYCRTVEVEVETPIKW